MRNSRRKNNIIIAGLCSILVIMGVGYAAFASQLKITGSSKISSNWDIEITNIESTNIIGSASNKTEPTYTATTATFSTNLVLPGDSITYNVTIENKGTIDGVLKLVDKTDTSNSAINFDTSGVKQGDVLKVGEKTTYTVKVSYNSSVTSQPDNLSSTLTVTFDYIQDDGNDYSIPTPTMMAYDPSKAFWQSTYEDKISTIDILTTNSVPSNAVESWDVSEKQDGSVMAYIIDDSSNNGMYKLYIGGEGGVTAPTNSYNLFSGYTSNFQKTTAINGLENLDTSNVTNMYMMFYNCSSLTSLDVSNFDTSNVTNMYGMFDSCESLTNLDVSNFDTSKVTNMGAMFQGCGSLTNLDVSKFDTSNVTNMSYMFNFCSSLTNLDVSNFDTSNVTNMSAMFKGCGSLTNLDLSNFDTSKVTDMMNMFSGCSSLTSLDVSKFDTSKVTAMNSMFRNCSSLTSLNLSNFDTSKVTNMVGMFFKCSSLTSLDLSNFDTSKVTKMSDATVRTDSNGNWSGMSSFYGPMFYGCKSLTTLNLCSFDTSNITNMQALFAETQNLKTIYVGSKWTTDNADTTGMFAGSGVSSVTTGQCS